jgi:hypothetical protein
LSVRAPASVCADEAEKRNQLQNLVELAERRATSAEKDSLRDQIAGFESEKRALAESNDGLGQKLAQVRPLPTQGPFRNPFQEPPPSLRNPFQEPPPSLRNLFQEPPEPVPGPSGEQDFVQQRLKDKAAEEGAAAEKGAAERAAAEKGAAEEKRLPIFELVTGASALIIGGVGLWLLRRAYKIASAPVQELLRKALVNPEEAAVWWSPTLLRRRMST